MTELHILSVVEGAQSANNTYSSPVILYSKTNRVFLEYLYPKKIIQLINKIISFRGELTNIFAKKAT